MAGTLTRSPRGGLTLRFIGCYAAAVRLTEQTVESTVERREDGDTALVTAAAAGDRHAFARLYDRYAPTLLAVGRRMLGGRREAEDLVHDVFLEAWRRADGYDPSRGSVRAWLLVRLRSRAMDRHRAASGGPMPIDQLDERAAEGEDPALAPDRAAVRRALERLPSEQRAVLELGYFHGLSSSEIAVRTGAPIGTVKSRAATGLARLRAGLAGPKETRPAQDDRDGVEGGAG